MEDDIIPTIRTKHPDQADQRHVRVIHSTTPGSKHWSNIISGLKKRPSRPPGNFQNIGTDLIIPTFSSLVPASIFVATSSVSIHLSILLSQEIETCRKRKVVQQSKQADRSRLNSKACIANAETRNKKNKTKKIVQPQEQLATRRFPHLF